MPISSAPRLLALYLLQLLGLSTTQLEELKVSDWVNRLLDNEVHKSTAHKPQACPGFPQCPAEVPERPHGP